MKQVPRLGRIYSRRIFCVACLILIPLAIIALIIANSGLEHDSVEEQASETFSYETFGDSHIPNQFINVRRVKNCDKIHLAIVCGGFNSTRDFYVLLKSILFYRTNVIQLHLFVDNISKTIFKELFSTWKVPDFYYRYYNITSYEHEVSWIPSLHYSHRYGLMKLVFLSVLADIGSSIDKLIILDTDMLVLGNIKIILDEFDRLKHNSDEVIIGLVENQSDWYLGGDDLSGGRLVWPAIGRGYNTGLMVIDLNRFKLFGWDLLWRQVAEKHLVSHLSTALADQDIINAVIKEKRSSFISLPCFFNLQLNDHTKLDEVCPIELIDDSIRIVHWNSPHKFETKNKRASQFNKWYLNFRNWDAKLLERKVCYIDKDLVNRNHNRNTIVRHLNDNCVCSELQPKFNDSFRTFLYFMPFELGNIDEFEVTAVVHLSIDRFRTLNDLAAHWQGPISAAIYLSELETNLLLTLIQFGEHLARRKNIGYHLVFRDYGFNYPINKLRNIALNNAITPYVFLLDIDFLPSFNLHENLKSTIKMMASSEDPIRTKAKDPLNRTALVVPSFESSQYKFEFPLSKADLEAQINLGSVSMFREQLWPRGHSPTNYAKWLHATRPYQVDWKPEYEPFIVASRNVSRFDERFIGFGWNKVEHIMQLAAMDYKFLVLPDVFVIHQFHSASYDIIKHRESHKYRSCIRHLKKNFLIELSVKYPEFFKQLIATSSSLGPTAELLASKTDQRVD